MLLLDKQRSEEIKTKCDRVKNQRIQEYKEKTQELSEKERDLCRQTNQLINEFIDTCDDTPFHKALIKILRNLKGIIYL